MMFYPPFQPFSQSPAPKPKRAQVRNACTNCQKACKRCDEVRPCTRCTKYGIPEECVDSERKKRKAGVKRGPYKRKTQDENIIAGASRRILPLLLSRI